MHLVIIATTTDKFKPIYFGVNAYKFSSMLETNNYHLVLETNASVIYKYYMYNSADSVEIINKIIMLAERLKVMILKVLLWAQFLLLKSSWPVDENLKILVNRSKIFF